MCIQSSGGVLAVYRKSFFSLIHHLFEFVQSAVLRIRRLEQSALGITLLRPIILYMIS